MRTSRKSLLSAPRPRTLAVLLLVQSLGACSMFSGDGSDAQSQYNKPAGGYISNFAPDITSIKADAPVIAAWKKANPGKQVGSFGPPTYGATQILLTAIKNACTAGHGTLKSAPRGYPVDHPRIDLLRFKGLTAWRQWPVEPWLGTSAAKDRVISFFRTTQPLCSWLSDHVGR